MPSPHSKSGSQQRQSEVTFPNIRLGRRRFLWSLLEFYAPPTPTGNRASISHLAVDTQQTVSRRVNFLGR
jgi:hypothetical protein